MSLKQQLKKTEKEVTDLHHLIEQSREALIHSEKMASVGEMAAGIAHELGNPLAAIIGRVELQEMQLKDGKGNPDDVLKTFEKIKFLCDRMTSIIRGMKSLSRDGTSDPFQNVSLCRIINDVVGFACDSFLQKEIKIHIAKLDEKIKIWCQETQISQVFVNLINNAKDAISSLEEKWIKIDYCDKSTMIEVSVTDSGKGVPKELQKLIMTPFFTTKSTGHGSGLGLSISSSIIEDHGGALFIDAESPNTRFVINLPKNHVSRLNH